LAAEALNALNYSSMAYLMMDTCMLPSYLVSRAAPSYNPTHCLALPPQVLRIPEESVLRDAAVRQNLRLQVLRTAGGAW